MKTWLDGITDSMDMTLSNSGRQWRTGEPAGAAVHRVTESDRTWRLNNNKGRITVQRTTRIQI